MPNFYVEATPKLVNHLSGQPVGEKTGIIEVPGARIDRYRKENPNESSEDDAARAVYLASGIVIPAVAKATNIGGGWQLSPSDCSVLAGRPEITKSRPADFQDDGMGVWVL